MKRGILFLGLGFLLAAATQACRQSDALDILIRNGRLIDGTGSPGRAGDLGILDGQIQALGRISPRRAKRVIEAAGLAVAPGFIDVHTHCDRGLGLAVTASNENFLTQGVTTVVAGNCGSGSFDIAALREAWEKNRIGTNVVLLAGLGTIRTAVMGTDDRNPEPAELSRMQDLLREALRQGAGGLSAALQYIPDRFATTSEVVAMTRVAGEFGGIFNSHQRSESSGLLDAVRETIQIAEETGVRVNATHLKAAGKGNWGLLDEAVALIEEARGRGVSVTADLYTYPECVYSPLVMVFNVPHEMDPLTELVPMVDYYYIFNRLGISREAWQAAGRHPLSNRADLLRDYTAGLSVALRDPRKKERIRRMTLEGSPQSLNWVTMFGWDSFTLKESPRHPELVGRTIADIARDLGLEAFDVAAELLAEEQNEAVIGVFTMSEEEIARAVRRDWMMIGSDAGASISRPGIKGHPGPWGTFPRVFRKYVREEGLLSMEEAVYRLAALPARFLGLEDRGHLRPGAKADIVVFDPEEIRDQSVELDSLRPSGGIIYVLVNGRLAVDNGRFTGTLNGHVLDLGPRRAPLGAEDPRQVQKQPSSKS